MSPEMTSLANLALVVQLEYLHCMTPIHQVSARCKDHSRQQMRD